MSGDGGSDWATNRAVDALREMADAAASDISREFPGVETAYDMYVDWVSFLPIGKQEKVLLGVINMGDAFQYVGVWVEGVWDQFNFPMIEAIEIIEQERVWRAGR